jgi:hypothetical protein
MTVVAYTGEQLNQALEIEQMLKHLTGLVEDLKQHSKVAADRVYKFALAA